MKHTELRQFLKEANAIGLSPIEKDVFQYYYSRTQNEEGEWYCPDNETAEDICRSRNGVCAARKSLATRGWITAREHFNITVVKTFSNSVRNQTDAPEQTGDTPENPVPNQTETPEIQSETGLSSPVSDSSVSNQTETPENPVSNQTPLIPYKGKLGTEGKKEKKQEQNAGARLRSAAAAGEPRREEVGGGRTGIPVGELLGEMPASIAEYQQITSQKLLKLLGVKTFPDKSKNAWEKEMQWAFENDFSPDEFIECYEVLKRQKWRMSRVSPETVAENLPLLSHLKLKESEESEINGSSQKYNANGNGHGKKPTAADIIASRPYRQKAGSDG